MITKKYIEPIAKYTGLVAVSFEWSAVILFYILQPNAFSGNNTISYFAALPETRLTFGICFSLAAICFWIFTRYHLNKHYDVPIKLFALSMLGFAATAIVPLDLNSELSLNVHIVLAQIFSVTFLIGQFIMAKRSKEAVFKYVTFAAVLTSAILMGVFLTLPKNSSLIFLVEAASGIACQLWTLWITYHSFRLESLQKSSSPLLR